MSIRISTDFDGGALGEVAVCQPGRVVAEIPRDWDQDRFNTQATWYYVRFDGLAGQPLEVTLTGLGSVYNGRENPGGITQDDLPFASDDGQTWYKVHDIRFDPEARTYTMQLRPRGDTLWVANLEPYVASDLERLEADLAGHRDLRRQTAGTSVEGRPIPLWTIGDDAAPRCVWILARQHAWETHTSYCIEGAIRWLLSDEGAAARAGIVFRLMPMVDPDGVACGASRFNRHGYDVNRHWNETDPANPEHRRLRPEIAAAKAAAMDWLKAGRPIDFHLNLHDTQWDYLEVVPELSEDAMVRALYDGICAHGFAGKLTSHPNGHPGVCQTAMYRELGVRAALIELGTASLSTYGRCPTRDDRLQFGRDLAKRFCEIV